MKEIDFYSKQFSKYTTNIGFTDFIKIPDIAERHLSIQARVKLLNNLQPVLTAIVSNNKNLKRSADGAFPELIRYMKFVEGLRLYVDTFDPGIIELAQYSKMESEFQLDLISKIATLEAFYNKSLIKKIETEEDIMLLMQENKGLSLSDLQLI